MKRTDAAIYFRRLFEAEAANSPQPLAEYRFHPPRRWRFDAAWPDYMVAVEIDGGNRMVKTDSRGRAVVVGGHTKDSDYEKINAATEDGWRVLRFSTAMLQADPIGCIEQVTRVLLRYGNLNAGTVSETS